MNKRIESRIISTRLLILWAICWTNGNQIFAQSPIFEWAKSVGGNSDDIGRCVAVNNLGNVYTIGDFSGTVDFDPGLGIYSLSSAGPSDIFIQKLDSNGNFIWAKRIGGLGFDHGSYIFVDTSGFIYATGSFHGTVDFDPGVGVFNLVSAGSADIFILKLDPNGDFIWAEGIGGTQYDYGLSIKLDINENIYITGGFMVDVDFNTGVDSAVLVSNGYFDSFLLKLDSNGNYLWTRQFGGVLFDDCWELDLDIYGNVFITGWFSDTVDFDPDTSLYNLISAGSTDIFAVKLDSSGNLMWAHQFGGSGEDKSYSIFLDTFGDIYITGFFEGMVDFDPGSGTNFLHSNGSNDIFILKITTSGDFIWARSIGGSNWDHGTHVCVDAFGIVYVSGTFQDTVDFDPGVGTYFLSSVGGLDIFFLSLDASGDFIWACGVGGIGGDNGMSISVDTSKNVFLTGRFRDTVDFDPGPGIYNINSLGQADIFVLKLSQCSNTSLTDIHVECGSFTWIDGLTYSSSNNTATWTLANAAGCDSIITLDLTILPLPDVSTSVNEITITANENGASYQWIDCNNSNIPIQGAINQSFTASANGDYAVIVSSGGCSDTSACVNINSVGLHELEDNNRIIVYPNPTTGTVHIEFENAVETVEIVLMDIQGKVISRQKIENKSEALVTIEDAPGVYLLTIKTRKAHKTIQVVKE